MLNAKDRESLRVVLVRTRNPLNIGSVARVMSNFGFGELRLVTPYTPSFREARSAVGAAELLQRAKVFDTVAEAVEDCSLVLGTSAVRDREVHIPLMGLEEGAVDIRRALKSEGVAVLFGSEKTGLSSEDLSHCDRLLRISTREEHVSMNLAQAVAVTLYEISRQGKTSAKAESPKAATSAELARITTVLLESLRASGYTKPGSEKSTEQKVRLLIRRLQLKTEDAEVLLTMFRKMLWKIEH